MDELEEIRKRKLEELQAQYEQQQQEQQAFEQQRQQLEFIVKQHMTKEAISRYGNIKIAHPEKSVQALVVLAQLLQEKKILVIDDKILKDVLLKLTPEKKEFTIKKNGTI